MFLELRLVLELSLYCDRASSHVERRHHPDQHSTAQKHNLFTDDRTASTPITVLVWVRSAPVCPAPDQNPVSKPGSGKLESREQISSGVPKQLYGEKVMMRYCSSGTKQWNLPNVYSTKASLEISPLLQWHGCREMLKLENCLYNFAHLKNVCVCAKLWRHSYFLLRSIIFELRKIAQNCADNRRDWNQIYTSKQELLFGLFVICLLAVLKGQCKGLPVSIVHAVSTLSKSPENRKAGWGAHPWLAWFCKGNRKPG